MKWWTNHFKWHTGKKNLFVYLKRKNSNKYVVIITLFKIKLLKFSKVSVGPCFTYTILDLFTCLSTSCFILQQASNFGLKGTAFNPKITLSYFLFFG